MGWASNLNLSMCPTPTDKKTRTEKKNKVSKTKKENRNKKEAVKTNMTKMGQGGAREAEILT